MRSTLFNKKATGRSYPKTNVFTLLEAHNLRSENTLKNWPTDTPIVNIMVKVP